MLNHGHYAKNDDHGGGAPVDRTLCPAERLPDRSRSVASATEVAVISGSPATPGEAPVVQKGQSFTFQLSASDIGNQIWHSLTSCKSPCNKSTGIAYPIADGDFQFDSGQLGVNGAPTVNRTTWTTPADLPVGTHTFYCRASAPLDAWSGQGHRPVPDDDGSPTAHL